MNVDIEKLEQIIKLMENSDIAELTMKKKSDGAEELIIRKIPKYPPHMEECHKVPPMPPQFSADKVPEYPHMDGCHKMPPMPPFSENFAAASPYMAPPQFSAGKVPVSVQAESPAGNRVESPLVGTFYAAPSPDEEPFVKVGDTVKKGQVLGIVEAMKLMNEIECEFDGIIADILVKNGDMVEYGQPLFIIQ